MSCDTIQEQLGAYRDGELDEAARASVAQELASCERCQAAYREHEAMAALIERAVLEPAQSVDLTGFADEVMARIAVESSPTQVISAPPSESWLDRVAAMLGLDGRGLALAGAVATAAIVWGLWPAAPVAPVASPQDARSANSDTDGVGKPAQVASPRPRRGMELETASSGRNAASVQQVEVAHGRVVIDDNADDPDRPVVVWHIVGEEVDPETDASP